MKPKWMISSLAISLCLTLAACGGPSASDTDSMSSAPSVQSAVLQESQSTSDGPSFADGVLTCEDYTITITDYRVIQPGQEGNEYGEKPVIAFWYDTTNTGAESDLNASTAWILVFEAVQDNDPNVVNTLNVGMLPDDQYLDSQLQSIKVGGTVPNAIAYELDDEITPVTLTAKDILGSEYGSQTFAIAP